MMELNFGHLYGDLLNTYGDYGNYLVIKYLADLAGVKINYDVISLDQEFDPDKYDFVLIGGGQDFEQSIIAPDIIAKTDSLKQYINDDKVMLAICGGYQLLGKYYIGSDGQKISGTGILPHYTESQNGTNRFTGNITIKNEQTGETYQGFENHNGVTYLGEDEQPLGKVISGHGNNGVDQTEGAIYRNVFNSYFHGPVLTRNLNLAKRLFKTALAQKYPDADLSYIDDLEFSR